MGFSLRFTIAVVFLSPALTGQAQVAVKGQIVYTMAAEPVKNGVVIIQEGKFAKIGPADTITIPAGFEVLEAMVVTPGLIDAHTVVGLSGQYNSAHDQDQLEHSEPIQPELRAIDAYNAKERLVTWVRQFGVTTIHTGHAPGELISGQTLIAKTAGNTVEESVMVTPAAVTATLAESALKKGDPKKSPGTRSKMIAMLRELFIEAREYLDRIETLADSEEEDNKTVSRNLKLEIVGKVLKRDIPLLITAHRAQDIANAMRLAEEFQLRLILDGAAEAYLLLEPIRRAGIPVIIHPTMMRAFAETENASFETASKLIEAGIPVALQSGYESYVPKTRVVLFEAGYAAKHGLSFEQALGTITIQAARILDIDDRVGSIEVGKDGDLALYDGDPFEYTSHCMGVVINGQVISRERH